MEMKTLEVFDYSRPGAPIIRMQDRQFPGYLIPGDALNNLVRAAFEIENAMKRAQSDPESFSETQQQFLDLEVLNLSDILCGMLSRYESVLIDHNIRLPYDPPLAMRERGRAIS